MIKKFTMMKLKGLVETTFSPKKQKKKDKCEESKVSIQALC